MTYTIKFLREEHVASLIQFFVHINVPEITRAFHPHPFTVREAYNICQERDDIYCAMFIGETIVAYGMLRGWEEGYDIPSLGIVVSPEWQGKGLSKKMMYFLHHKAYQKGANSVRLTVYKNNLKALNLYTKLGYRFEEKDNKFIGLFALYGGGLQIL